MEFRLELTVALAKIIQAGRLTHAEIAKHAGTSRTRVTAIAKGNTHGVSPDVLIRVLAATGHRAEVRVKKDGKDTHLVLCSRNAHDKNMRIRRRALEGQLDHTNFEWKRASVESID